MGWAATDRLSGEDGATAGVDWLVADMDVVVLVVVGATGLAVDIALLPREATALFGAALLSWALRL